MPMTTRTTVDALLPDGVTVDDLNEHELGELFQVVLEQTVTDEETPPTNTPVPPEE